MDFDLNEDVFQLGKFIDMVVFGSNESLFDLNVAVNDDDELGVEEANNEINEYLSQ